MTLIHKTLTEILESQAFERLEPFKQSTVWSRFAQEERALLARLLVMQGAVQLAQGNQQVLESFDYANQICSNDCEILYQQGMILSSYRENIHCLTLACQTLYRALQYNPLFFKGWVLRAQVLVDIGLFEGESSYFIEANQCYESASPLLEIELREEFFWKWGLCLASLGKISGEPVDFHHAIEKFRQAFELGCQESRFFNDFGRCLFELGTLFDKPEYFTEALVLFNRVVLQNPEQFDGWYLQGCCLQSLIGFKIHDKLLEQADHSFSRAVEINPSCSQLWLKWGQLDAAIGKLKHDTLKLEGSILKFAKAYQLEAGHPQILRAWADSELWLGAQEERLDLIQSARLKILNSLEIQSDDSDTWYLYGSCLNELGCYFSDEDYYNQAIEKFQYGLSLNRQHPLLWYGLALAHFALGELTEQQALFEKAVRYCSRVIECGGDGFPQFWNDWGVALLKLGEMTQQASYVEMAIEKFERALKQPLQSIGEDDLDLEWVYNYSCAYDLLGDLKEEPHHFEKAIQIFLQILQLDPNYTMARYNLAIAYSHLGDAMFDVEAYHKAIDQFQMLLDQNPEDDMVHLDFGMSLINLGLLVDDGHHPERSETLYRQAEGYLLQAAALGSTQSHYQLAGLYSITKHFNQSIYHLERALFCGTLPGIEDLLHDEWLENVRHMPPFRQFINTLSSRPSMDDN